MKNLLIVLSILCFASCAFAEMFENETYQTEKSYTETMQNNSKTLKDNSNGKKSEEYHRRVKFSGKNDGPSQSGTHYNFGSGSNYGIRGKF